MDRSDFEAPAALFGQQRKVRGGDREITVQYALPEGASLSLAEEGKGVGGSIKGAVRGKRCARVPALPDGRRILLDRGFVPIGDKDAARPPGPVAATGNLVWPREGAARPDRASNVWIARDVPLLAKALAAC